MSLKNPKDIEDPESLVRSQLKSLKKLAGKLKNQSETIDRVVDGDTSAPNIINAIQALDNAFGDNQPPENTGLPYPPVPSTSRNLEPAKNYPINISSLPELPLIKDENLRRVVFIHQSVVDPYHNASPSEISYDRLELLGDAYIEVLSTKLIWERFLTLPAGRISQMREFLVRNDTLAGFADLYGFDKKLKAGRDVFQHPKRLTKVKGDVFEAFVAAVILADPVHGLQTIDKWLTQLWLPTLTSFQADKKFQTKIAPSISQGEGTSQKLVPYKEQLQRRIVSKGIKLKYKDEKPPLHTQNLVTFFVGVYLTGWGYEDKHLGSGSGPNKAEAGGDAAKQALESNPLIDELRAIKLAFDEENKRKKESALEE